MVTFDNLSRSHLQSQVNCEKSVGDRSLVVNLIGQRSRDVIGRLSVSRDVIGCEDCEDSKINGENRKKKKKKKPEYEASRPSYRISCVLSRGFSSKRETARILQRHLFSVSP